MLKDEQHKKNVSKRKHTRKQEKTDCVHVAVTHFKNLNKNIAAALFKRVEVTETESLAKQQRCVLI